MTYIYQQKDWPNFKWDSSHLMLSLAQAHQQQGRLLGRMEALGFSLRSEAMLRALTIEVIKNSEIENEILDADQVRSSIARRLGMDVAGLVSSDRSVEGAVEIMLDATQYFAKPLTKDRLLNWHAALFPTGRSGMHKIVVADWRNDIMQVVSGPLGRERVHFEAVAPNKIEKEMQNFFMWFNEKQNLDPILKAGIAHLWFVTIHPFDDGNGRIARTLTELQLARADGSAQRFYSLSAQIKKERAAYLNLLEKTQKGDMDITHWLEWFLTNLNDALASTEKNLADILTKARFWETYKTEIFNERQRTMLNKLLDGKFIGKLTSSKWAKITKCSPDTALRDIQDLINKEIFVKEASGGRSTSYALKN